MKIVRMGDTVVITLEDEEEVDHLYAKMSCPAESRLNDFYPGGYPAKGLQDEMKRVLTQALK